MRLSRFTRGNPLLHRQDVLHRRFQFGVRSRNLRMTLAFLQLFDEFRLGALVILVLVGNVLVSGADLLLVVVMTIQATLGFEYLGPGLSEPEARGERRRNRKNDNKCFHVTLTILRLSLT